MLPAGSSEPLAIVAKKTILATGGLGQVYQHSTNYPGTVGHGIAMAYRVGARLIDLEYVQFHPTVFYGKHAPRFLITEAIRGEGAVLVNLAGEAFMETVHPRGSLAPRDIVSRAIHQELAHSGEPCVYLDLSSMDKDYLHQRFPSVYESCLEHGVDISSDPIPVVPAAHYSCGGVHADLQGRTNILHLNAIGETACTGLHGANRLASTSLLECLTSAKFAARADIRDIAGMDFKQPDPRPWQSPRQEADPTLVAQDLNLVQQTMWNYAGIVRSPRRLTRARRILLEAREEIQSFYRDCQVTPELVELRNAVQTALLVVHAASLNPRSKGAHYVIGVAGLQEMENWKSRIDPAFPGWEGYRPLLGALPDDGFPDADALNALLPQEVKSHGGPAIRFVPSDDMPVGDYERQIFETGRVSTRGNNWHDLFNALAWCRFPRLKAAMNAMHHRTPGLCKQGAKGTGTGCIDSAR